MGLLSFMTGTTPPYDAAATQARVDAMTAALPEGAEVTVVEPDKDIELTYLVSVVTDRATTSALLRAVTQVAASDEGRWTVSFSTHDSEDESSAYSSLELPSHRQPLFETLLAAHDELYAVIPGRSISLDADDGTFAVSDVPAGSAVATARAAAVWWERVLATAPPAWVDSSLSVDIGGDGVNVDVTYSTTVEREPELGGRRETGDAEWVAQVLAAWTDSLPVLEAVLRLPVPPEHAVDLTFSDSTLRPRLSVTHHDTFEEDEDAANELVATVRRHVPGTTLEVG
jgi:hypothetical protein